MECQVWDYSLDLTSDRNKNGHFQTKVPVAILSKPGSPRLCSRGDCFLGRRGGLGLLAIRFLPRLANVDAAFEERAVFNGDARRNNVSGQRAVAADIDAIA